MSDLIGQPMAVNGVDGIVVEQDPARGRVLVNFPGEPVRQEWVDLGGASGAAEAGTTERSEIVESMARTLFVTSWADQEEEAGRTYPGQDLMDVAPPTTPHARSAAIDLAASIEKMNGMSLDALYQQAEHAEGEHTRIATPEDFGYSLAMMSLGHGVSWFDNHPEFPLKTPDIEYYADAPSANEAAAPPQTKQGKHGQLYHYRFIYTDKDDTGFGEHEWSTWAYNQEHAIEKFYSDGDESWKALRIARLPSEGVRMTWHKLAEAGEAREEAKSTRTYRVMLNSNKSLHLVEAKSIKEARSKALAQYGSDFNGLVYEVENRNGVWASLRRTGAREEATPNTPERQREQEWMWKPYSVSVQFKRADGSTYYNRLGFDDEDTAISAGAKLSMGPDVETVFVKANGGREVWSWWPGKQAEETPRSMREDNVILTNDQGRPIEKPRREDFPSDVKYIHSFHAYRDRVASAANIGFGEGFRKAMRGAHEARPGGIDPTSGYAQAWRRIQAYVDATRPGYEVDSAVIPAGDGRWQFAIRPRTGGRWETVIAPNAEIDRVSQATYVSEEAPRGGPVDEDALVELQLYADNTAELYPQKQAIIANISRRIKNGSYNPALAPQLWSYWVDEAAKRYSKEFGLTTFNKATREELARRLAEEEYAELRVQSGATEGIAEETRYRSAGPNSYFVEVYTADGRTIKFDERVSRERAFADAIDILKNGLVMHGESKGQNGRIDVRGLKVIQMRSGSARGKGGASEAEARDFSTLKDLLIGAKAKGAQYVKKATAADAKRIETDEGVHVSHLVYFKANGRWVVRPVFQAEGLAHLGSFGVLVSGISVDAVKIDDAITDMEKVLYADEGVAHGAGEAPGLNWHGQPWDDSFIVAPDAKKKFGDRRAYQYMPFYLLSPSQKAQIKQGRWPHGSFYDEHYFYPRKKDGTLMHARRVLAIPYALIGDEPFMKSIGYEKTIEGKMWQQAQEPIDASEAGERALVIHEEASDHHRKVTSWLQKKKLSLDWADSIWDVPPWEGRDKRKNHTTLLMHDLEIPGYRDSTEMRVKVDDFVAYAKKHAPPPPPVYDIDESMSQEAHGGGRMAELRAELPMGFTVETYSPGDGITRYRFFENAAPNQDYFGPGNGMHTALGYKKAFLYAQSLHDYAKNLTIPQKTHLAFNKVKSSFTLPKAPGAEEVPLMAPLGPMAGGCLPWVRVTRDPERYGACLAVAQKIGPITDARKVYDLLHEPLMKEDQEVFIVILCDVQGQLRGVTEVHRGGRSRVGVAVSDVMRVVLATGAEMYLVCHGHPSGKARPSEADRHLTKEIQKATKLYGSEITFVDHVVIGHKQFYSIVEDKLFKV